MYTKNHLIPSIIINSERLKSPSLKMKKVLREAFLKFHNDMASLRGNNNTCNCDPPREKVPLGAKNNI